MEDLFRWVALRAPDQADPNVPIDLSNPSSSFQTRLSAIHSPAPGPLDAGPLRSPPEMATHVAPHNIPALTAAAVPAPPIERTLGARIRALTPSADSSAFGAPTERDPLATFQCSPETDRIALAVALNIARSYINDVAHTFDSTFISDARTLPLHKCFDDLYDSIVASGDAIKADELEKLIRSAFSKPTSLAVIDDEFRTEKKNVYDSIIATFLYPPAHRLGEMAELTKIARLMSLIERAAAQPPDTTLARPGEIWAAISRTLLLPRSIFPIKSCLPQPVGMGDLLVVKQQLKRYEAGEITNIENILLGESRNKSTKHALTLDRTVMTDTEKTKETTTEFSTTERFELKTEAENTVKEDLSIRAGVNVSAKYGTVEINANAQVAYGLSKSQSTKASTDHAKEVTQRAASKVTERVRQQITTRTLETFEEDEDHGFDNKNGHRNISGVYQWINKVYEAQVYNYGQRLLFDLMIPEPAAFLLDAVAEREQTDQPKPPDPFLMVRDRITQHWRPGAASDLGPDGSLIPGTESRLVLPSDLWGDDDDPARHLHVPDANDYDYRLWVGKYGAAGVQPPPEPWTTASKGIDGTNSEKNRISKSDDLPIPAGYEVSSISVVGAMTSIDGERVDGDEGLWVYVGNKRYVADPQGGTNRVQFELSPSQVGSPPPAGSAVSTSSGEQGSLPVAVAAAQAGTFAVAIDVRCRRTDSLLEQWKLDTYGAITNAYQKLLSDYHDSVKARSMQKAAQSQLGANPLQNRIIERTELKKACISRLSQVDIYKADLDDIAQDVTDPNAPTPPRAFPRPNVSSALNQNLPGGDQGAFTRFFEEAFEWENMMYVFYPYFWGRTKNWYTSALLDNADPLFAEFLKAGSVRVVVPVRLQLEGDVRYFLMTGQIWGGGGLPEITDTDYLPITEEIKARDNAPGNEVPQGDPWDVVLPTALVRLRDDDSLPLWKKFVLTNGAWTAQSASATGREAWVPGRAKSGGAWAPDYGTYSGTTWTPP